MDVLEETQSSDEEYAPRPFPWRRLVIAAALVVLLVLAIFLPPLINLGKYRRSLTASMSEALGRPVYVGGMQLRLLPMPGIVMSDFTVDEDPAFGYEPALHAASVVASLRITSLWRGRLEVSRISLDEANLNLVKNRAGQWSIGPVLLRASQISNALTAQRRASARPRFPYIEATNARIDFKDGAEKKPFSLMNAKFAMWQANADEWRLRLDAQPVRTDLELHLSDTGEVNIEGSLRRAAGLDAMPVDLRGEWSGAQLGQVTRMIAGVDTGWRGDLDLTAAIRGNIGDFSAQSRVRIGDLRRQEYQPATNVDVDATCRSEYHRATRVLDNITCFWPVASGHLLLTGQFQGWEAPRADMQLEINQIPAAFPASLLALMRPRAQSVAVTGIVNGSFHLLTGEHRVLSGDATATGVSLRYPAGLLALPTLHFVAPSPAPAAAKKGQKPQGPREPFQNAMQLQPIQIAMGETEPLSADARFTRSGFELHLQGSAALSRLLPAAANFGLLENAFSAVAPRGRATLDTTTMGNWMRPFSGIGSGIGTTGTLKLESLELRPAFLPAPVEVDSAEVDLTPEEINWQKVALRYRTMTLAGAVQFPVVCTQTAACPAVFTLTAPSLNAAMIETAVAGNANRGFFGEFLTNALGGNSASWPLLRGQVDCDALQLGALPLHGVRASVTVEGAKLTLSSLDASVMGGTLHASAEMAIENNTPHWKMNARFATVSAAGVAEMFAERWGPGQLSGDTTLTLSGYRTQDLASSAIGDFSFTWQNGELAAPSAESGSAFGRFDRWTARGTVAKNTLTVVSGGISRAGQTSAARGTITFDRDLNLSIERRRGKTTVTGTLSQPLIQ